MKIVRDIFAFAFKCLCLISAISLFISYFSKYVSPAKIWFMAFFGLFFQILFVINVIFLLFWAITRRKRLFFVHLVALFPSIFFFSYYVKVFGAENDTTENESSLKIITYNVQMFQLRYKHNDSAFRHIADFINVEKPDVVCLQEFYIEAGKLSTSRFFELLKDLNYYAVFYSINNNNSKYGIATFSRYPIKMNLEIPFENSPNAAMYSDIDVEGRTVRVYNVHFQSIRLNLKESLSKILGQQDEARFEELEDVSGRLKTAFIKRAKQVDDVARHIGVSPYSVIVCGDFNDMPTSYTYHKMIKNKSDSFREAGKGIKSTYDGSIPLFRIDYIMYDKSIKALTHNVPKIRYSDHFPVISTLDISKTK